MKLLNNRFIYPLMIVSVCLVFLLSGCNGKKNDEIQFGSNVHEIKKDSEERKVQRTRPEVERLTDEEAIQFMIEKYGFTESEMEGYDIASFVYELEINSSDNDLPVEYIHHTFDLQKGDYLIGGYNDIFGFLSTKPTRALAANDKIVKIGLRMNAGSGPEERYVYNLTDKVAYYNDLTPVEMSDDHIRLVRGVVDECDILNWELSSVKDDDENSTGSYGWNIAFELEDGNVIAYHGYVQDPDDLSSEFRLARSILVR